MKIKLTMLATLLLGLIYPNLQGFSQELFQKKEVLQINIVTNLRALLKDKKDNTAYYSANLSYSDEQNETMTLPIKLKQRGNFRRTSGTCDFPPLLLNFPKKKVKNTLFDNQDKLKLVTQCLTENLVFHEYLVYEIYNLLTDISFKARLVEVKYIDSLNKRKSITHYGFFIEDETDLAKRNEAKNSNQKNLTMAHMDSVTMATVAMFEYLIGNNDWSVPALHNIKLFTQPNKIFLPTPYDFDHSGIVDANYALPPPQLELSSVRERLYRGLDYSPEIFQQVFDKFNSLKPKIYALYVDNPLLDNRYIKQTVRYLDAFYEDINDPKAIKKHFIAGRTKN